MCIYGLLFTNYLGSAQNQPAQMNPINLYYFLTGPNQRNKVTS